MTIFQTVILGLCGFAIILGVVIFAFIRPASTTDTSPLVVWGTMPQSTIDTFFIALMNKDLISNQVKITYVEKDPTTFSTDLTEAVADNDAPDLVFIDQDEILKNENRLAQVPFSAYSQRLFMDTFTQEGELFLSPTGVMAFPLSTDPLVTYWNRDMFSTAAIAQPPAYWDQLLTEVPQLTTKDAALNIQKSAVALGEWSNIPHAKQILSALIMQAGSPIVSPVADTGTTTTELQSVIDDKFNYALVPGQAALDFYTQFSNPVKTIYSWNRSLSSALDSFTAGDSAIYFGFASELPLIQLKNPNLNFDVAAFPQSRSEDHAVVFGTMTAVGVVRSSLHQGEAFSLAEALSSAAIAPIFDQALSEAPARRDLLAVPATDPYLQVFDDAALQSEAWLDPDPAQTDTIFQTMIESVVSGSEDSTDAVNQAGVSLSDLLVGVNSN